MKKLLHQHGAAYQRRHYDDLVRNRRPTRYCLSCGYHDRFEPGLLDSRPQLRRALERVFDRIFPDDMGTVLDLGCGTSYYWPLLAERCSRLIGVDLSREMMRAGRRHHGARDSWSWACGEADALPLATGSVDMVVAIDALHHSGDVATVIREVRRVLRPGGLLVAVEPNVVNPVVFVAHLVPSEERGALWPNHPIAVMRALEENLSDVSPLPLTYISGLGNRRILRLVELIEPIFERPPLAALSLRRVYRARRT